MKARIRAEMRQRTSGNPRTQSARIAELVGTSIMMAKPIHGVFGINDQLPGCEDQDSDRAHWE